LSLILAGCFLVPGYLGADETFRLSFDEDLNADYAEGAAAPQEQRNLKLVQGVNGQGVFIPENGVLNYAAQSNISADAATVAMWVKLNWTPTGTGGYPDFPDSKGNKSFHTVFYLNSSLRAMIHTRLQNNFAKGGMVSGVINCLFSGDWFHLAFTWDAQSESSSVYINGNLVDFYGLTALKPEKFLQLGSENAQFSGLDGVMDEVLVFNQPLKSSEVIQLYAEVFPVTAALMDYAGTAGKDESFRIRFVNLTSAAVKKDFSLTVMKKDSGEVLKEEKIAIAAKPDETITNNLFFTPPAAGDYRIKVAVDGLDHKTWEITAIAPESITAAMPSSPSGAVKMTLLEEIDCGKEYPADKYRDDGSCRVVKTPAGAYRETTLRELNSGFAYRFKIKHPGEAHWLEIEYPDDSDRMFYVAFFPYARMYDRVLSSGTLDTMGVLTGGHHPVTGKMQTKKMLFWPDSDEFMVTCFSFKHRHEGRVAISKIRLYENDGPLPKLEVNYPESMAHREFGIWDEDPSMATAEWFNRPECYKYANFEFWKIKVERMVKYLRFSGKNTWSELLFDYHGDNSGTTELLLPFSYATGAPGRIPGWADLMATVFDREKIPFFIELNWRTKGKSKFGSGALGKTIGTDNFSGTFAEAEAKGAGAIEQFTSDNQLYLCERATTVNPLHPKVQQAYLKIVRAYRDKFGKYAQFQGINIITPFQIEFYSNQNGYEDYTTELFERETGIKIPVEPKDQQRFSKRYQWLKENNWDKWIAWRCEKVRDIYAGLLKELNTGLAGKKMIAKPGLAYTPPLLNELLKTGVVPDLHAILRERGVDMAMLGRVNGLIVAPEVMTDYDRTHVLPSSERYFTFSSELAELFKDNQYPAVAILRSNLEVYPGLACSQIKSFWWPVGSYITDSKSIMAFSTPQPNNSYLLENMTWTLAEIDPQMIDHGFWGCPENGAMETYQPFHKAYLSIPGVLFQKAAGANDPVTMRIHNSEQGHWFYLVNKAYYPVKVSFVLNGENARIVDAVGKKDVALDKDGDKARFARELQGHEVLVFKCPATVTASEISQTIPGAVKDELSQSLVKWERKSDLYKKIYGVDHQIAVKIIADARKFFDEGRYTQAQYRLQDNLLAKMADDLTSNLALRYSPDGKVTLEFINTKEQDVSGTIRLLEWPTYRNWKPAETEKRFEKLGEGETFNCVFNFDCPKFHHAAEFGIKVELALDGEKSYTKTFKIAPYLATKNAAPAVIDGDLADWGKDVYWYKLDDKNVLSGKSDPRTQSGFAPYKAEFAWRWSAEGLILAVKVEDKDFMPPAQETAMYLADCLQVYFDQRNNKSLSYDNNDIIYQVGSVDGKPTAWREHASLGQKNEITDKVKVAVKRAAGATCYEVLFPAEEFAFVKMAAGTNLGFSILINNLDQAGTGTVQSGMTINSVTPYNNPGSWRDLILTDALPVK